MEKIVFKNRNSFVLSPFNVEPLRIFFLKGNFIFGFKLFCQINLSDNNFCLNKLKAFLEFYKIN